MTDYSQGYYDLSITIPLAKPIKVKKSTEVYKPKNRNTVPDHPLVTDEVTVETIVNYFFTTPLGRSSGLDPDLYGETYILGFKNAVHVYDCEKTAKTVNRKMIGKAIADNMPNALPSEKNYGFKTAQKFDIFSRKIESYKVFPIPQLEKRRDPNRARFKPVETYQTPIRLKTIEPKREQLAFQGRQTTKTSKKSGGRSKEFTNVDSLIAYKSRLYKEGDQMYAFIISRSGLLTVKRGNDYPIAIGQLRQNKDLSVSLVPQNDLTPQNLLMFQRALKYISSDTIRELIAGRVTIPTYEQSLKEYKQADKKRRRIAKSKTKVIL
jgi:hypothetical protein